VRPETIRNGSRLQRIYLSKNFRAVNNEPVINATVEKIFASNGMVSVTVICKENGCSERQLERMFRKYIGVSPEAI
jgi:transcriptional regulator GlxA family with amidase domain